MSAEQGYIIAFLQNPLEGAFVEILASINGVAIVYDNGLNSIDLQFTTSDSIITSDPLHKVKIGLNAQESSANLKTHLDTKGYTIASMSVYTSNTFTDPYWQVQANYVVGNHISWGLSADFVSLTVLSFDENPIPKTYKKYFMQYKNIIGDEYSLDIFQKGFEGQAIEIHGRVIIERNEVKNHFEPIRGQGLNIQLEASTDNDFEDLFDINEMDYPVRFYRNGAILFDGYLKPDGVFQSFTSDVWIINIQAVDGLGFLTDLSFTKTNGLQFSGKMSLLDIAYNCLLRTGVQTSVCTCLDVKYYGMNVEVAHPDVLKQTYVSVDRFIRSDDNTVMSCLEVLTATLNIFNAFIVQQYGRWFIVRPTIFNYNEYPVANEYKTGTDFYSNISFLNRIEIGSQIDGSYPYHCGRNQQIEIRNSVSAARIGYKYGFVGSILGNGNLYHTAGTSVYESWTVLPFVGSKNTGFLSVDPVAENGIRFISGVADSGETIDPQLALRSVDTEELFEGYTFDFKTRFSSKGFPSEARFIVELVPSDGSALYNLKLDGSWSTVLGLMQFRNSDTTPNNTGELVNVTYERSFTISSQPLPKKGVITVFMQIPLKSFGSPPVLVDIKSIEIINTFAGNNVVGEFHTANRINRVSSLAKLIRSVSNGDNINKVYEGALYQQNKTDLTTNWYRDQLTGFEVKPILQIMVEDELRIAQKNNKLFTGDVYGFCYYLAIYRIKNISGKFMPIYWNYNTYNNITKLKLLELFSPDITDINYIRTDDYGQTVKPTIVG
jgi:hypothetical protein